MDETYKPASGRHTITGTLAKNIQSELFWVGIPDSGAVVIENGKLKIGGADDGRYDGQDELGY